MSRAALAGLALVFATVAAAPRAVQTGLASYYGAGSSGQRTASGDAFDPGAMTAAHASLPFGSRVRVTVVATGKSAEVTINDRPGRRHHHLIDVTPAAARKLGIAGQGTARVKVEVLNLIGSPKK